MQRPLSPAVIFSALVAISGHAADHREAPLISNDPLADNTDVYAFLSPIDDDRLVLAASYIPFQEPTAGGIYYEWSDEITYIINVDNDGDAIADIRYEASFETSTTDSDSAFYNSSPISSLTPDGWNRQQRVTVVERADSDTTLLTAELVPPANIGGKSTPDYTTLFDEGRRQVTLGQDAIFIYVGPIDDPFFADFQFSDLLTLRGQAPPFGYSTGNNEPQDSMGGFNVSAIILELPVERVVDSDPVLGVWATARTAKDGQISRTGTPLFGRLMLSMDLKDLFNSNETADDLGLYPSLQEDVEDLEVATALCTLYGVPLPGDANADCHTDLTPGVNRSGRGDMFDFLMTGLVLANDIEIETKGGPVTLVGGTVINRISSDDPVPAEMLRINTSINRVICAPIPHRLGLLAGDVCGFPNGRRFMDDVFDIELLMAAGALYSALDGRDESFSFDSALLSKLTDRIDANDKPFIEVFPYAAQPHSGQEHRHTLICLFIHGFESLNDSLRRFREAMRDLVS